MGIKQGDKALQQFPLPDIQQQLSRHLLKTLGLELTSELLMYVVQDSHVAVETKDLTNEVRFELTLLLTILILIHCLRFDPDPAKTDRRIRSKFKGTSSRASQSHARNQCR